MNKLSSIAYYVTDKISSNDIALSEYITTDCILQNKKGREIATNLPPQPCCLTRYQHGDVLIANLRPYLKKVWFADIDGVEPLLMCWFLELKRDIHQVFFMPYYFKILFLTM